MIMEMTRLESDKNETTSSHTSYLSFFYTGKIFGEENLHRNLHSKLPIYTVNCQFFALNLKKFTPAKKNLHGRRPWRP